MKRAFKHSVECGAGSQVSGSALPRLMSTWTGSWSPPGCPHSDFVQVTAIIELGERKHLHKMKISKNGSIAIENNVGTGAV